MEQNESLLWRSPLSSLILGSMAFFVICPSFLALIIGSSESLTKKVVLVGFIAVWLVYLCKFFVKLYRKIWPAEKVLGVLTFIWPIVLFWVSLNEKEMGTLLLVPGFIASFFYALHIHKKHKDKLVVVILGG